MKAATAHAPHQEPISVFLMDLWCIVPYYTSNLCRALQARGLSVRLGSISYHLDPACFDRAGVRNDPGPFDFVGRRKIPNARLRQGLKMLEFGANMSAVSAGMFLQPPSILHVQFLPLFQQGLGVELPLLKLARSRGAKLVYTVHDRLPHDTGERLKARYQDLYRKMDALICHTQEARDRVAEEFNIPKQRIHVIPHGPLMHDLPKPSKNESRSKLGLGDGFIALWQGLIKPYKGIPFLLDAWAAAVAQNLKGTLVIAGMGAEDYVAELRAQVASLGIADSVRFDTRFAPVEEVTMYYQAADAVVFPYREITTSGALMTGAAHQKAMITTALPAFREVLRDGHNALLVEYGNTAELASALLRLASDPAERERIGSATAALLKAENSWESIAELSEACYRQVLGRAR